jgi:hypothetical protein
MCSTDIYPPELKNQLVEFDPTIHPRDVKDYPLRNQRVTTLDQFIMKSKWVHGIDRYDYTNTIYDPKEKYITITCPIHGDFKKTKGNHITRKSGCPVCGKRARVSSRRWSTAEFINKSKQAHGDRYDYQHTTYTQANQKVKIICNNGHEFFQRPADHVRGTGCPYCSNRIYSIEELQAKINKVHGEGVYSLPTNFQYVSNHEMFNMTCHTHGTFRTNTNRLLCGNKCPKCSMVGSYTVERVPNELKENPCILYHIRISNESVEFDKIGITQQTIHSRFKRLKKKGFNITVIKSVKTSLISAIELETEIKQELGKLGVSHKIQTLKHIDEAGWTECFETDSFNSSKYFKRLEECHNITSTMRL